MRLDVPPTPPNQISPCVKLAYRIDEACEVSGLGRTTIYAEIKAGRLKAFTAAGRRLIMRADLEQYLKSCAEAA